MDIKSLKAQGCSQRAVARILGLPRGFVRVRHFGLQANPSRSRLIARARQLLHAPSPPQPDNTHRESWQDLYRRLTGRDPTRCSYCHRGKLRLVAIAPQDKHNRSP